MGLENTKFQKYWYLEAWFIRLLKKSIRWEFDFEISYDLIENNQYILVIDVIFIYLLNLKNVQRPNLMHTNVRWIIQFEAVYQPLFIKGSLYVILDECFRLSKIFSPAMLLSHQLWHKFYTELICKPHLQFPLKRYIR